MFKILIVDDEPVICQGLSLTVPWDEIGVEIVGTAHNGAKALQIISDAEVDIVISDVRMPIMDGLELAKQLHENHSSVRMIMISGYEDFHYVQQALRYGVKDYLLKPVNIDELFALVKRLLHEKIQLQQQTKMISKEKIMNLTYRVLLETIFDSKVFEELVQVMRNKFTYRIIVCEMDCYAELLINEGHEKMEAVRETWLQQMNKALSVKPFEHICMFLHQNQLFALCYSEAPSSLCDQELYSAFREFTENSCVPCSIYWGLSDIFEEVSRLQQAYQQTSSILDSREPAATQLFLTPESLSNTSINMARIVPAHYEDNLVKSLFQSNIHKMCDDVEQLFTHFASENYLLHEAFRACQEICHVIYRKLQELKVCHVGPYDSYFYSLDLKIHNTMGSLKRAFMGEMKAVHEMILKTNHGKNVWVTERALQYIKDHYHEDLKASEIAEKMKITPNYFSLIFKQETGKNFNEYLNDIRIEEAKEMLATTYDRVFEVAEKVGYNDYKYFVNNFKKKVGVTPTEYRNLIGSKITIKAQHE